MKENRWAETISRNFFRSVLFAMSAIGFGAVSDVQAHNSPQLQPMTEDDEAGANSNRESEAVEGETIAWCLPRDCVRTPTAVAGVRG